MKFFKQLFCKHDFRDGGVRCQCASFYKCHKCEKQKWIYNHEWELTNSCEYAERDTIGRIIPIVKNFYRCKICSAVKAEVIS